MLSISYFNSNICQIQFKSDYLKPAHWKGFILLFIPEAYKEVFFSGKCFLSNFEPVIITQIKEPDYYCFGSIWKVYVGRQVAINTDTNSSILSLSLIRM